MTTAKHHAWSAIAPEALKGSMRRQFVVGDGLMIARVTFRAGDLVAKHAHHNEQITQVLEGHMRFFFGEDGAHIVDVHAGELVTIPAHLPHAAEILADTISFDIFTPPREDWIAGTDIYLRG